MLAREGELAAVIVIIQQRELHETHLLRMLKYYRLYNYITHYINVGKELFVFHVIGVN